MSMEVSPKSIPVYYETTNLSKITQINMGGKIYDVINFSFLTVNDQQTLVVVYKDKTTNVVNVSPFDFEMIGSSTMDMESMENMGGKKKKSKKSKP